MPTATTPRFASLANPLPIAYPEDLGRAILLRCWHEAYAPLGGLEVVVDIRRSFLGPDLPPSVHRYVNYLEDELAAGVENCQRAEAAYRADVEAYG